MTKKEQKARRSDEELARAAAEGDERALAELYARHMPLLRKLASRRLRGGLRQKVAESDVVQNAWIAAFAKLDAFEDRGPGSFRAWLSRIVERKAKDEIRRYVATDKRGLHREIDDDGDAAATVPDRAATPGTKAVEAETKRRVTAAIEELPEHYRQVIRLVHEEQRTMADAAEVLGKTAAATRMLYGRAVDRLSSDLRAGKGEGR